MNRYFFLFLFWLGTSFVSWGQSTTTPAHGTHHIFATLGGGGLAYSFDYEYQVHAKWGARAGVSALQIIERQTNKSMTLLSFPLSCGYLIPIGASPYHTLEVGIGTMNLYTYGNLVEYPKDKDFFINPYLILGYRIQPAAQRWSYQIKLTPVLGTTSLLTPGRQPFRPLGSAITPWAGIGIGYRL